MGEGYSPKGVNLCIPTKSSRMQQNSVEYDFKSICVHSLVLGKTVFTHLTGLAHQHKDIPSLGGKIGLHVDKTVKYYLNRRKFTKSPYVHPDFINMNSRACYSHSYMLINTQLQSKQLKLTSLDFKGKYYPSSRPLG